MVALSLQQSIHRKPQVIVDAFLALERTAKRLPFDLYETIGTWSLGTRLRDVSEGGAVLSILTATASIAAPEVGQMQHPSTYRSFFKIPPIRRAPTDYALAGPNDL
ncbi:hypothetical protein ASG57_33920 [Bradyrhizobium sp. Leaf396]|jgi:hypothetical protein|nr:hypothetical protein ASG57_33920 [Bradyrhizobium sp. Leaf396]